MCHSVNSAFHVRITACACRCLLHFCAQITVLFFFRIFHDSVSGWRNAGNRNLTRAIYSLGQKSCGQSFGQQPCITAKARGVLKCRKNQYHQYPASHFFLSVFAPWWFKKNAQMTFKLSSQNESIVSGMGIKEASGYPVLTALV